MSVRAYLVTENGFCYNDEFYDLVNDPGSEIVCPHRIFRSQQAAEEYVRQHNTPMYSWDGGWKSTPALVVIAMDVTDEERLAHYEKQLAEGMGLTLGMWYCPDPHDYDYHLPKNRCNAAYPTRRLEEVATLFGVRPYGSQQNYPRVDFNDLSLWEQYLPLQSEAFRLRMADLLLSAKDTTCPENLLVGRAGFTYYRPESDEQVRERVRDFPLDSPEAWAALVGSISPVRLDAIRIFLNELCFDISQIEAFSQDNEQKSKLTYPYFDGIFDPIAASDDDVPSPTEPEHKSPLLEDPDDPYGQDWFMGEFE
jgi:hypothetical protein